MSEPIYVIVARRTAWWPVPFAVPAQDDPGYVIEQKIDLKFAFIDDDALGALAAKANGIDGRQGADAPSASEASAEVYMAIVTDWRGVGGPDGKPLAFNKTNFASLLASLPGFEMRWLLPAYQACIAGEGEIRKGN